MINGMAYDLRLIEDYLPIAEISKEASREKSVRKGHISTLHLWWARRPLVACRAAVYGALVSADRWVPDVTLHNPPDDPAKAEAMKHGAKRGLNRRQARDFVSALCKYPGDPRIIDQARQHILDAHAQRLSAEIAEARKTDNRPAWMDEFKWDSPEPGRGNGDTVTASDIAEGRAPRPRVLDMFAGGGAIPLEALRLGCEAYALDLNPVAHIIQLCTLVYPQRYGKPDSTVRGMTGKPGKDGELTWGGLAEEVRHWGNWVLQRVTAEIGDLYPLIPDPEHKPPKPGRGTRTKGVSHLPAGATAETKLFDGDHDMDVPRVPPGYLMPVAYLWTRTVKCKNPSCGAIVPLMRQTWLCNRPGRFAALKPRAHRGARIVEFAVVDANSRDALGFDPEAFSEAGNATCPFCGTVADNDHVRQSGRADGLGVQMMGVVAVRPGRTGKVYLPCGDQEDRARAATDRLSSLLMHTGIPPLTESVPSLDSFTCKTHLYGLTTWADLFLPRQQLCLLTFVKIIREMAIEARCKGDERLAAVVTLLGCWVDRLADFNSSLCTLKSGGERGVVHTFTRQALPMVWDFAEANPLGTDSANAGGLLDYLVESIRIAEVGSRAAQVRRGSATGLPWANDECDAIITDPPYYDNVSYANLSDFFYVWLKRSIGELHPEHFGTALTPKKAEVVAEASRLGGRESARSQYESMMAAAFREARRCLKPTGEFVVVYAHKTTLGWSTLVEAMRAAGFVVAESWPLDTEMKARLLAMDNAALASSIFLVARKREMDASVGNYEDDVQPELEAIVQERVATLWEMGITGADLVIACVGAGLRAFTKYERVEYASGEPVPADKFLAEVEAVVLDTLIARLMATTRRAVEGDEEDSAAAAGVGGIDATSRFYILWRYLYKAAELDAGEAIIFANGLHVELDGQGGLCDGRDAILEKKKSKYRLRDYADRGHIESLGLRGEGGQGAPLIDVLHRALYLMEHRPAVLREYLDQARPNRERLRLLAASLVGPGLSGKSEEDASRLVATTAAEQSALGKLLANWRTLVPESIFDANRRT